MSDTADQQDGPSVVEFGKQADGPLTSVWRSLVRWVWEQERSGLLLLTEGLALLGLFCFAPWFSWQGVDIAAGISTTPAAERATAAAFGPHSYSGWATALGIPIPFTPSLFLGYLWLIPLIGLAFMFLVSLRLRRVCGFNLSFAPDQPEFCAASTDSRPHLLP